MVELALDSASSTAYLVRINEKERLNAAMSKSKAFEDSLEVWRIDGGERIVVRDVKEDKAVGDDAFWLLFDDKIFGQVGLEGFERVDGRDYEEVEIVGSEKDREKHEVGGKNDTIPVIVIKPE